MYPPENIFTDINLSVQVVCDIYMQIIHYNASVENFSVVEKFSYLSAFQRGGGHLPPRYNENRDKLRHVLFQTFATSTIISSTGFSSQLLYASFRIKSAISCGLMLVMP